MEDYLRLKKPSGWYGLNNYHIVVAELDGRVAGLCVSDYAANANTGIIEFLVVVPEERGRSIGKQLLGFTENLFVADAFRACKKRPNGIVAEMNDPFRIDLRQDNFDPFDRAAIWHGWGFKYLRFRYVQPSLSQDQAPAEQLILLCKPLVPCFEDWRSDVSRFDEWPGAVVREVLRAYLEYAMRIADPDTNPQFVAMKAQLEDARSIRLQSLAAYIGREPPIDWHEVRDRLDPLFVRAMKLYRSAFNEPGITISDEDFAFFLEERRRSDLRYSYHLWVAPEPVGDDAIGLASFFTFRHCGFGGYTCRKQVSGTQAREMPRSVAIACVEERMRRDNPAIEGWFIECDPKALKNPVKLFYRHGFRQIDLEYRQPRLPGTAYDFESAPVLQLLYKPFGEGFDEPKLSTSGFLAAMEDVFQIVYGVKYPTRSRYHQHLRAQLVGEETVPFRSRST